ncbi:MAG: RIP metalloprotease RseP, partial [Candidatus Omnitrophica bacterium]|nr:RIP metalloprotease RseP [Candidatus Omnitrophota bacterium]
MISLLVFLAVLSVLIVVHELGHFLMAKKLGVRVEKFSLGFGKCILSRKKNETEYSLSAIPLGGYVKLSGDNLEDFTGKDFEYYSKSVLERALIIFFGPLANYILGFLIFWLIFFAGFPTLTNKVGGVMSGFGAEEAGIRVGDKVVAVEGRRVMLWEELQDAIKSKKPGEQVELSVVRGDQELTVNVKMKGKDISDSSGRQRHVGILGIMPDEESLLT